MDKALEEVQALVTERMKLFSWVLMSQISALILLVKILVGRWCLTKRIELRQQQHQSRLGVLQILLLHPGPQERRLQGVPGRIVNQVEEEIQIASLPIEVGRRITWHHHPGLLLLYNMVRSGVQERVQPSPAESAWQDSKPGGRGNTNSQSTNGGWEKNYMAPPPRIAPPLQHGWKWGARAGAKGVPPSPAESLNEDIYDEEDKDMIEDSDDIYCDGFDSDESQKSHETRENNKLFKEFFDILDKLTLEETNSSIWQWHCPACQDGPGAINCYKGLQPLMAHAKTKGQTRVKLHREFAELLDEVLIRKGTSVIHVEGESNIKFEMRSYKDILVTPMKQMSEENQQLHLYKNRLDKNQRHTKGLVESL
ncbi:hypothetical protein MKW94_020613, partial [Papaver nudicaule]|nr:hypothetical protein [Papaver nudicaule]